MRITASRAGVKTFVGVQAVSGSSRLARSKSSRVTFGAASISTTGNRGSIGAGSLWSVKPNGGVPSNGETDANSGDAPSIVTVPFRTSTAAPRGTAKICVMLISPPSMAIAIRRRNRNRVELCVKIRRGLYCHLVAPGLFSFGIAQDGQHPFHGHQRGRIVDDDLVSLVERTARTARSCAFSAFWHRIRLRAFRPTPNSPKAGRPWLIVPIVFQS